MQKLKNTLERDKFLTEVTGGCWYDLDKSIYNLGHNMRHNNFSTWEGFGRLWEWAIKQEWWLSFGYRHGDVSLGRAIFIQDYINPDRFADAVYEYLREREVVDG